MKILVAEDDRATQLRLQSDLAAWGYEPVVASNGREAWELYQAEHFPLVISDWMMPEMDGLELVRNIRSERSESYVFVIMLTAQGDTSKLVEGMEAGADDFVSKPFERDELRVRLRAGQRIVELERRLADSNAELTAFTSVASHDLREPLRTITSFLSLLERDYRGKLDKTADEFIDFIMDAAGRMRTLIDDLLAFARLEQGDREPFKSFSMREVFDEKIELLNTAIEESGALTEIDGDLPAVYGDRSEISQVVQNLLSNAIKYRGEAAPVIRVSSGGDGDPRFWSFAVSDNGIGIPEEHLAEVFQPFRRLHGTGSEYKGSGVGLAICQKVIDRHGGKIWVESEPGRGSTFHFTIAKPAEPEGGR
jgi:signal transduction histidine kinase